MLMCSWAHSWAMTEQRRCSDPVLSVSEADGVVFLPAIGAMRDVPGRSAAGVLQGQLGTALPSEQPTAATVSTGSSRRERNPQDANTPYATCLRQVILQRPSYISRVVRTVPNCCWETIGVLAIH